MPTTHGTRWGIVATGGIAAQLRPRPGPGPRRRARRRRLPVAWTGPPRSPTSSAGPGPTPRPRSWPPTPTSTSCTSPPRTPCTSRTPGRRSRPARRCCARRRSPSTWPTPRRWSAWPAAHGVFLMEAMWMACNPVVRALREGLGAGRFGEPRQLHADLGFVVDRPADDRLLDPALGGGALLDMGIYPLTFAHLMLGEAEALAAHRGALPRRGRPRRRDRRALRRRRGRRAHRVDDLDVPARRHDRDHHRPHRGAGPVPPPVVRRLHAHRRGAGADRGRRAADRLRPRHRGGGGAALPRRGPHREPAGAARADPDADAPDGRAPRPDRGQLSG